MLIIREYSQPHSAYLSLLFGVLLSIYCIPAASQEDHNQRWQVNGFIAQGLTKTDNSGFINFDNSLSLHLTELGLSARYTLDDSLSFAGQIVYLDADNRYVKGARVDYAFVDWQTNLFADVKWSLHAQIGRVKNGHWLYSDTRDVPHTRLTTILPQSIYFDGFRDVALSSDGVAWQLHHLSDKGTWQLKWSLGSSPLDNDQRDRLFSPLATGTLTQTFTHQVSVFFAPNNTNLELGISVLDSDFKYVPGAPDSEPFSRGRATSQRVMLHVQYYALNWEFSSEIMRERAVIKDALFNGFLSDEFGDGGYVQGRYMIDARHSILARIDVFDKNEEDRAGQRLIEQSQGQIPGYFTSMDQVTLGWRWEIADRWQLQTEFHRTKGAGRLTPILFPNSSLNPKQYWSMASIQLIHWF